MMSLDLLIIMVSNWSQVVHERWNMSETMNSDELIWFMLVWCESKCISFGDGGSDVFFAFGMYYGQE